MMSVMVAVLALLGAVLVVVGVGLVSVPAGLVVAGVASLATAYAARYFQVRGDDETS